MITLSGTLSFLLSPLFLTTLVVIFGCIYYYVFTKQYGFWTSRGVPGPRAKFPWGNEFGPPLVISSLAMEDWLYNKQGGKKFCGYFELHRPALYVGDLDLIREICIKDFEYFTDRRQLFVSNIFNQMLQVLKGEEWKKTRAVMTPTFSSSKLRQMHQLCLDNANNLGKYVQQEMAKNSQIDLKDVFGRFTMDNISSCAFGVNCNSFVDPNSEFARNAADLFKPRSAYRAFRLVLAMFFGAEAVSWLPDPLEKMHTFFKNVLQRTIDHREKHGSLRKDFLQLMLETRDKEGHRILTHESIIAQSILFFFAGYDTTATLLTFAAYCLATSPDWQQRVLDEIDEVLKNHDGQLTYDAVLEMSLLDRVLSETLRLYPPATRRERQSTKAYTLPGTSITIPAGTLVQMPIMMVHRDPEHFPEPLKFDPDRFLPEEKEKRHSCAYMPFGVGPRNCIAMRFALFEAKVALIGVLHHNRLEPAPCTPLPPMPLNKKTFLSTPEEGCAFLKAVSRNN